MYGIYLKRSRGGEMTNVSVPVVIGVNGEGFREILGSDMKTCEHVFASFALGRFSDGESALMLVCARLRFVVSKEWGVRRYLNMTPATMLKDFMEVGVMLL